MDKKDTSKTRGSKRESSVNSKDKKKDKTEKAKGKESKEELKTNKKSSKSETLKNEEEKHYDNKVELTKKKSSSKEDKAKEKSSPKQEKSNEKVKDEKPKAKEDKSKVEQPKSPKDNSKKRSKSSKPKETNVNEEKKKLIKKKSQSSIKSPKAEKKVSKSSNKSQSVKADNSSKKQEEIKEESKKEETKEMKQSSHKQRNALSGKSQESRPLTETPVSTSEDELVKFNKLMLALGGEFEAGFSSNSKFVPNVVHKKFVPNTSSGHKNSKPNEPNLIKRKSSDKQIKVKTQVDVEMKEEVKETPNYIPNYRRNNIQKVEGVLGGGDIKKEVVGIEAEMSDPEDCYTPITFSNDKSTELDSDILDDSNIKFTKKDSKFRADVIMEETEKDEDNFVFHCFTENGQTHFKDNEWYFIQLPQFLNVTASDKASELNMLRRIPAGKIGKLRIHKSGKVSMILSPVESNSLKISNLQQSEKDKEVVYNINHGVKQTFYNEMAYITSESITFLPKVTNKVVVSPDITSML